MSMLVISDCKQIGFLWFLEAISTNLLLLEGLELAQSSLESGPLWPVRLGHFCTGYQRFMQRDGNSLQAQPLGRAGAWVCWWSFFMVGSHDKWPGGNQGMCWLCVPCLLQLFLKKILGDVISPWEQQD